MNSAPNTSAANRSDIPRDPRLLLAELLRHALARVSPEHGDTTILIERPKQKMAKPTGST